MKRRAVWLTWTPAYDYAAEVKNISGWAWEPTPVSLTLSSLRTLISRLA